MQIDQMDVLKKDIGELVSRVNQGGRKARAALIRLISLAAQPNAKKIMKVSGVEFAVSKLMKSSESSDELQGLAGSILTIITVMPVTSERSDEKTGSYGHVNIVVSRPSRMYRPDQTMLELSSGVQPSETSIGDYLQSPDIDA